MLWMHFKALWMLWTFKKRLETFETGSSFSFTHTLVACSQTHYTHRQLGRIQLLSFSTTFRASIHGAPIRRCVLWCFSLADLIVGVQTAARVPFCSLLFRYSRRVERRCPSSWSEATHEDVPGQPAGTIHFIWKVFLKLP